MLVPKEKIVGALVEKMGMKDDLKTTEGRLKIRSAIYLLGLHPEFKKLLNFRIWILIRVPHSVSLSRMLSSLEGGEMPAVSEGALKYLQFVAGLDSESLEMLASIFFIKQFSKNDPERVDVVSILSDFRVEPKEKIREFYKQALKIKKKYGLKL